MKFRKDFSKGNISYFLVYRQYFISALVIDKDSHHDSRWVYVSDYGDYGKNYKRALVHKWKITFRSNYRTARTLGERWWNGVEE